MSLVNKNYSNSSGTISRSFRIGKNRLIVDNEVDGSLRFSLYDSTNTLTQWKMNSDDNSIEFPTGDKIVIDKITKTVLFSLGVNESLTLGTTVPETSDLSNFNEEKMSQEIPNTWAVWEAISRVITPLNDRIDELEERIAVIETQLGIVHE